MKPFVHPGSLHSRAELEFIKQRISADELPCKYAWEQLQSTRSSRSRRRWRERQPERIGVSSLEYIPSPLANVVRGARNDPNIGSSDFSHDSIAAYSHALQWWMTGKQNHADKAIEILNAWSATLETISGHDARLLIGMGALDSATPQNLYAQRGKIPSLRGISPSE